MSEKITTEIGGSDDYVVVSEQAPPTQGPAIDTSGFNEGFGLVRDGNPIPEDASFFAMHSLGIVVNIKPKA